MTAASKLPVWLTGELNRTSPGAVLLTLSNCPQVWDAVVRRRPQRAGWIDQLGADLEYAESARRQQVEAALSEMLSALCDISHFDDGQVERLVESQAHELNKSILDNR